MTIITTVKSIMVGTGSSGNLYKSMQEHMRKQKLIWHEDAVGSNPTIPIGLRLVAHFLNYIWFKRK